MLYSQTLIPRGVCTLGAFVHRGPLEGCLFTWGQCNSRAPPRHSFEHGSSGLRGPPLATGLPRPPHWYCNPFLGTSCAGARGVVWCAVSEGSAGLGWPRAALVHASCGSSLAAALSDISELGGAGQEPRGMSSARVAGAVLRLCGVRACACVGVGGVSFGRCAPRGRRLPSFLFRSIRCAQRPSK